MSAFMLNHLPHLLIQILLERPYMISLQINCSNRTSPGNFQVNVEGEEGTVKFEMRINCSYSDGIRWFHKAFSDSAIGEIQRVGFMVRKEKTMEVFPTLERYIAFNRNFLCV